MTRISRFVVCASALCVFSPALVAADPVHINDGFMVVTGQFQVAPVAVTGTQGFSVTGFADPGEGRVDAFTTCSPCMPGEQVEVGAFLGSGAFIATVMANGQQYDLTSSVFSDTNLNWTITGPPVVAPPQSQSFVAVQTPFHLSGRFFPGLNQTPIDMAGGGVASLLFRPGVNPPGAPFIWELQVLHYSFNETPVPEPASLVLLGIGLATMGARRWRRHS
jgi:hypothetical protein